MLLGMFQNKFKVPQKQCNIKIFKYYRLSNALCTPQNQTRTKGHSSLRYFVAIIIMKVLSAVACMFVYLRKS